MKSDTGHRFDVVVSLVLFRTDPKEVADCIDQISASQRRTRIVVVDNSPEPVPLADYPAERVTVIRSERNVGYGRAHNRAIALARGEAPYHLVMNTDLQFRGDVIDEIVRFMDANPDTGLSSPKILYPDGRLQTSCRLLPKPINMFARGFFDTSRWNRELNRRYELQDWDYDTVENIPFLPGCFMFMRADVLERVGGFDERFFLFAEDLDLSRRIHDLTGCTFVPDTTIVHELRSRSSPSIHLHRLKLMNLARYFNKWGWLRDPAREAINRRTLAAVYGAGAPGKS